MARQDYELLQMDTDSVYLGLSAANIDMLIRLELLSEFLRDRNNWLACDSWSNRTPGLFKLEFEGTRAIARC